MKDQFMVDPDDHGWSRNELITTLSTPVFEVFTSLVSNSKGSSKSFYGFHFPAWVNIVARTCDHKLLLISQYRFGTNRAELEIPGGAVEKGEDPLTAGLRELHEETGFKGNNARIIGKVCPNPALQNNFCYTVMVENAERSGSPQPDEMEEIDVLLRSEEEVFELITNGTITHGLVLNALMFYYSSEGRIAPAPR